MSALPKENSGQEPNVAPVTPIKPRRSSLWWTLSICAIVLGYGLYTRWQWQKTQHPLQLRVLQLPPSSDKMGAPFLKIHIGGVPVATDDYFVQGPQWQVQLSRLQIRKDANAPWQDASPRLREHMQEQLTRSSVSSKVADGIETRWERQYWLPPGEHRIEGQFSATFYDDNEQNWDGAVQISEQVAVPTPTPPPPPPLLEGIAGFQYHIESTAIPMSTNTETRTDVDKMQDAQGNTLWKNVPARGENGFPLTLSAQRRVWFRPVQRGRALSFKDEKPKNGVALPRGFVPLETQWHSDFPVNQPSYDHLEIRTDINPSAPAALRTITATLVDPFDDTLDIRLQPNEPSTIKAEGDRRTARVRDHSSAQMSVRIVPAKPQIIDPRKAATAYFIRPTPTANSPASP